MGALWQPPSRRPSLSPLPPVTCFQSLASLTLTPLRWVPGLEGLGLAPGSWCFGRRGGQRRAGGTVASELCSADYILAQVYSPNLPPAPVLPSSIPPYAPVSQPTSQFILQGSLPLSGCWVTQSPAPVPTVLATASEPAGHAAATSNSEDRTATARPAAEKAKNEEVRPVPLPPRGGAGSMAGSTVPCAKGPSGSARALTHFPAPST